MTAESEGRVRLTDAQFRALELWMFTVVAKLVNQHLAPGLFHDTHDQRRAEAYEALTGRRALETSHDK